MTSPDDIDVERQMHEEMDEHGKLELKTASAGAVVGAGLKMQE